MRLIHLLGASVVLIAIATASTRRAHSGEPEPGYPDHTRLLIFRDGSGSEHPVRTSADWAKRRAHILSAMQRVMGPVPTPDRRIPLTPQMIEEVTAERYVRRKLTIAIELNAMNFQAPTRNV